MVFFHRYCKNLCGRLSIEKQIKPTGLKHSCLKEKGILSIALQRGNKTHQTVLSETAKIFPPGYNV
jgi:hypothetical protein